MVLSVIVEGDMCTTQAHAKRRHSREMGHDVLFSKHPDRSYD